MTKLQIIRININFKFLNILKDQPIRYLVHLELFLPLASEGLGQAKGHT